MFWLDQQSRHLQKEAERMKGHVSVQESTVSRTGSILAITMIAVDEFYKLNFEFPRLGAQLLTSLCGRNASKFSLGTDPMI